MYRIPLILLLLTSCSYVHKPLELENDAIEYAEALFKRQNQVTYQVMMLLEDEISINDEDRLSVAELEMHEQCHLLNEMAGYEMKGEKVSLYFKTMVKKSFKACDESVINLGFVLKSIG